MSDEFGERFATATGRLGHDEPAVRLAGGHAMACLADDWEDGRQTCIDALCAYLRTPARDQEVRDTVVDLIGDPPPPLQPAASMASPAANKEDGRRVTYRR